MCVYTCTCIYLSVLDYEDWEASLKWTAEMWCNVYSYRPMYEWMFLDTQWRTFQLGLHYKEFIHFWDLHSVTSRYYYSEVRNIRCLLKRANFFSCRPTWRQRKEGLKLGWSIAMKPYKEMLSMRVSWLAPSYFTMTL